MKTKKVYTGYGVAKMLDCAYKHNLNSDNSTLTVKDPNNLNSYWRICVK